MGGQGRSLYNADEQGVKKIETIFREVLVIYQGGRTDSMIVYPLHEGEESTYQGMFSALRTLIQSTEQIITSDNISGTERPLQEEDAK
jgi:hypothetical protein